LRHSFETLRQTPKKHGRNIKKYNPSKIKKKIPERRLKRSARQSVTCPTNGCKVEKHLVVERRERATKLGAVTSYINLRPINFQFSEQS